MFQMSCAWVLGCFDGGGWGMGDLGREGKADGGWRWRMGMGMATGEIWFGGKGRERELGGRVASGGQWWPTVVFSGL